MKSLTFIIGVCAMCLLCGCSAIMYKLYGITPLNSFDKLKAENFINDFEFKTVHHSQVFLDTMQFRKYRSVAVKRTLIKDFSQPVQLLYFRNDTLVSFHANCYARGSLSNLDWNTNNRFSKFVPSSAINLDSVNITINGFSDCVTVSSLSASPNKIFIVYSNMYQKITRSAINTVLHNIQEFNKENETEIVFLNIDQCTINIH